MYHYVVPITSVCVCVCVCAYERERKNVIAKNCNLTEIQNISFKDWCRS